MTQPDRLPPLSEEQQEHLQALREKANNSLREKLAGVLGWNRSEG